MLDKEINGTIAADLLKLSVRQIRRLKAKVRQYGPKALIHASRGKQSNRKIPEEERETIAEILKRKYPDFKLTFASEKLEQNHNIKKDPKTIRQIMIEEDLWKPKKKKQSKYHSWRKRKPCYGEMEQFDGSYHDWFESRNGNVESYLLASIDDATGIPTKAKLDTGEGTFPVFRFWKEYIEKYGKPHSIYLDKFSTYKMTQRATIENHETQTAIPESHESARRRTYYRPQPAGQRQNKTIIQHLPRQISKRNEIEKYFNN